MLHDSGEAAALMEIFCGVGAEELIDPIVTVSDDAIAEHLCHLLEDFFGLLSSLGHGTIMSGTISNISLNLCP